MAKYIHHIEGIKFAITFDVSWPNEISLMNIVDLNSFSEIRILNAFGNVGSFF